jgi:hypothetical protein
VRVPPRTLLIADCVLRSLTLAGLGLLAITERLTLPVLIVGLLLGATFRMAASSSRRLLATSMAGVSGRFAVNGLLGLNATFALYIVGPVLGGLIVASTSAGAALLCDAGGALILLTAVVASVPRVVKHRDEARRSPSRESGWLILRRRPVAARLLLVEFFFNFFFNFFYMPIEVALPLYVRGTLDADASGLGLMWGALGGWRFRRCRAGESAAESPPTSSPHRDHRVVGAVPDRARLHREPHRRDDRVWTWRPGVGAVHACRV